MSTFFDINSSWDVQCFRCCRVESLRRANYELNVALRCVKRRSNSRRPLGDPFSLAPVFQIEPANSLKVPFVVGDQSISQHQCRGRDE